MGFDHKLFAELTKTAHAMPAGPEKSRLLRVLIAGRRHLERKPKLASVVNVRDRLVRLAHSSDPDTRARLLPLVKKVVALTQPLMLQPDYGSREAKGWDRLPKGWTQESVEKLWDSLTGERKHKVTACIKKMTGKVDDPGAFCASLADMMEPGWRSERSAHTLPQGAKITGFEFNGDGADFYFDSNHVVSVSLESEGRKTAAAVHDLGNLPTVGDTVSSVDVASKMRDARISFSSGRSVVVHTVDDLLLPKQGKKKNNKKSESDIEPTHARKEWPELPPGVKAASVGAAGIRLVLSKVFHNEDALRNYLKQHPKADPSKHSVKGPGGEGKNKEKGKEKGKKDKPKDLSGQPGFSKLKGLSPEKQREVIQRALEMGKPKDEDKEKKKPSKGDHSDEYESLKGLSPAEQRKVIERALKMAALSVVGFGEGDKVVVTKEYVTTGGTLSPGDTATVTGVGSGVTDDQLTLALDDFSGTMSLTTGITAPPSVLQKQACGCGGNCGGSCSCATHLVDQFSQANPDLADKLSDVYAV